MLFENGDHIVFMGDSVTWWHRNVAGEGLHDGVGKGYVQMIENILNVTYPDKLFWITNTGVSGITSREITDGPDRPADWVSLMIGINDIWRRFDTPQNEHQVYAEEYRKNLIAFLDKTLPKVKGVILMSPYYLETNREDPMRKAVDEYIEICREVAKEYNLVYVECQNAFDEYLQYRHPTHVNWDRVHPGYYGSAIIAREFLKTIGMDRPFIG